MPDPAITFDRLQPLEVQADLAAQIAFDNIFAVLDRVNDLRQLLLADVLGADRRIDLRALEYFDRVCRADAVNVAQRDINALLARNLNTNNACHNLTLPLFVPRVRANHTNHALALDDLAILAKLFNRCSYFHIKPVSKECGPSKNRMATSPKSRPGPQPGARP